MTHKSLLSKHFNIKTLPAIQSISMSSLTKQVVYCFQHKKIDIKKNRVIIIVGKHAPHPTGLNLIDAAAFNNNADLDQTAVILYSSGTTGLPKGVMHSHRTTIGLSQILVPNRFYEPHILPTTNDFQDVTVSFLPFFHVYGLAVTLLNQLLLGSKVLSMKYEINHFLDSIVKHKATILPLVPPVVIQLNNHSQCEFRTQAPNIFSMLEILCAVLPVWRTVMLSVC